MPTIDCFCLPRTCLSCPIRLNRVVHWWGVVITTADVTFKPALCACLQATAKSCVSSVNAEETIRLHAAAAKEDIAVA